MDVPLLVYWAVAPNANILACISCHVKAPHWGAMPQFIGEKLRYLRKQRGLTQVELAEQIPPVTQAHLANLEAGRDLPSIDLLVRLAVFYAISLDYLLRDTEALDNPVSFSSSSEQVRARQPGLFHSKLRTLRIQNGLGQTGLARQLGLARRGYISNLETGRKAPSLDLLVDIAELFHVSLDTLFYE